jgi:hypothetical protein
MKRLEASVAGLLLSAAISVGPALGRPAPAGASCCRVPAGTTVEVELVEPVSTKAQHTGDSFALRLAAPLIVDGRIVLRAGAPGVGEVIDSAKPGLGGKPAKLVLAARYVGRGRGRVALQGLQMSGAGHDHSNVAQAVGLTGIAFGPLGLVGLAVRGGDVVFPAGMTATARLADDVFLPSLGRAPRSALRDADARSSASAAALVAAEGSIAIPPPPAGEGQVVFFRKKSLMGTGQWFNVREDGRALGRLSNGAYFIQIADPGVHAYTATTEPELKDHLKLEVSPGETYFVEGTLTKGVVIGTAAIAPSDRATFGMAAKDLRLAAAPTDSRDADQPSANPAAATSTASSQSDGPPAGGGDSGR